MPQGFQNVKKEVPPLVLYNANELEKPKDWRETARDHMCGCKGQKVVDSFAVTKSSAIATPHTVWKINYGRQPSIDLMV